MTVSDFDDVRLGSDPDQAGVHVLPMAAEASVLSGRSVKAREPEG